MSILGTCPECLHHTDGMCDLRPRICLNYDHFERRPMVTLTRDDFEKLYISCAAHDELNAKVAALQAALDAAINMNIEKNAEVVRLTAALAAANEDAGYLADAAEMLMQKWGSDDVVMFDFARISAVIEHYRARVGGAA